MRIILVLAGTYHQFMLYCESLNKPYRREGRHVYIEGKHYLFVDHPGHILGVHWDTKVILCGTYWNNPAYPEVRDRFGNTEQVDI